MHHGIYNYIYSEKMGPEMAAFQIIRGGVISIDLAIIQLSDGTSRYSILAASRGLTSDFIAASEKFRKFGLGYARYYLGDLIVGRASAASEATHGSVRDNYNSQLS